MKNIKKKLLNIKNNYFGGYSTKSYSQEGEDMVLNRIFEKKSSGFYIDVGAHHPKRFSNTYFFYKKGWSGVNIDAMPGSMKEFNKIRKRDINLELPISDKNEELTYYMFNDPALNGFSKSLSEERDKLVEYKIISEIKIQAKTLEKVLDEHFQDDIKIDFISIDVEGLDLRVLKSNNWEKYSPDYILIEVLNSKFNSLSSSETYNFLSNKGYEPYSKTVNTVFFKKNSIQ